MSKEQYLYGWLPVPLLCPFATCSFSSPSGCGWLLQEPRARAACAMVSNGCLPAILSGSCPLGHWAARAVAVSVSIPRCNPRCLVPAILFAALLVYPLLSSSQGRGSCHEVNQSVEAVQSQTRWLGDNKVWDLHLWASFLYLSRTLYIRFDLI